MRSERDNYERVVLTEIVASARRRPQLVCLTAQKFIEDKRTDNWIAVAHCKAYVTIRSAVALA